MLQGRERSDVPFTSFAAAQKKQRAFSSSPMNHPMALDAESGRRQPHYSLPLAGWGRLSKFLYCYPESAFPLELFPVRVAVHGDG